MGGSYNCIYITSCKELYMNESQFYPFDPCCSFGFDTFQIISHVQLK